MKRRYLAILVVAAWAAGSYRAGARPTYAFDQRDYVGNVVGKVVDKATGRGVPGAKVVLITKPWPWRGSGAAWTAQLSNLLLSAAVRRAATDSSGQFLVNAVPTPYPYRSYTVVALAPGYKVQVFDQVPVLPGAVMSLECRFALTRGSGVGLVFSGTTPNAPYEYAHERRLRVPPMSQGKQGVSGQRIFATREGLVGRTTANGHVVRAQDHFVALPSRRALSSKGGREFQVRLTYQGRSVTAPVWDVGPWNIRDDHWNPPARREQWRDLPRGVPQAQAAFLQGYNRGKDGFGRRVANPAGIDLADGVFRNDLRMRDNDWVQVQYLWSPQSGPLTTERREPDEPPATRRPRGGLPRGTEILGEILSVAKVILER